MCNIHGAVSGGKRNVGLKDFIREGFLAGQVRGLDSSGLAVVDLVAEKSRHNKLPVSGSMFVTDKYTQQLLADTNDPATVSIGHCRAATSGRVGMNEAHPFYMTDDDGERDFIGVHNGTLTGWYSHKAAKHYNVDSEWALAQIFQYGAAAFKEFTGAFCFVWWDSDEADVLNIALNDQRHMHVAFTEGGEMFFASEGGMLYWLMERNNVKLKGNILKLDSHNWYKFNVNDLENFVKQDIKKPVVVTQRKDYSDYSTRPSTNGMAALERIFSKIREETSAFNAVPALPAPDTTVIPPPLTKKEVDDARMLTVLNDRAMFTPVYEAFDAHGFKEIWGTITIAGGTDFGEAVIRRAGALDVGAGFKEWDVTVIGVFDDEKSNSFVAICSKPHIKLAAVS